MCKYCDTNGRHGDLCDEDIFRIGVDFGILCHCELIGKIYNTESGKELLNVSLMSNDRSYDFESEIKYCPMCGRKLQEGTDNV